MPGAVGVDQISSQEPFTIDMHKKIRYDIMRNLNGKIEAVHICISGIYLRMIPVFLIERYYTYGNDELQSNLI